MSTLLDQRLVQRIRAEYLEMPGMNLTLQQVRRLCGIEEPICRAVLESLVEAGFLCRNSDGSYARLTERSPRPRVAKAKLTLSSPVVARRAC
jgi:hypothetical protein